MVKEKTHSGKKYSRAHIKSDHDESSTAEILLDEQERTENPRNGQNTESRRKICKCTCCRCMLLCLLLVVCIIAGGIIYLKLQSGKEISPKKASEHNALTVEIILGTDASIAELNQEKQSIEQSIQVSTSQQLNTDTKVENIAFTYLNRRRLLTNQVKIGVNISFSAQKNPIEAANDIQSDTFTVSVAQQLAAKTSLQNVTISIQEIEARFQALLILDPGADFFKAGMIVTAVEKLSDWALDNSNLKDPLAISTDIWVVNDCGQRVGLTYSVIWVSGTNDQQDSALKKLKQNVEELQEDALKKVNEKISKLPAIGSQLTIKKPKSLVVCSASGEINACPSEEEAATHCV